MQPQRNTLHRVTSLAILITLMGWCHSIAHSKNGEELYRQALKEKDPARRIKLLTRAIQQKPSHHYYYFRHLAYLDVKEPWKAWADLRSAIKLRPQNPEYHHAMYLLYDQLKLFHKANRALKVAASKPGKNRVRYQQLLKRAQRNYPFRVEAGPFRADEDDIRRVCESAASTLWRHYGGGLLEPIVIQKGRKGPITLFKRNARKEIVVKLDTTETYWAQYAFQFAHEFCHVICLTKNQKNRRNLWFEETLCETASLFALRTMARDWQIDPPYRNWKSYARALRSYANKRMNKVEKVKDLQKFYRRHQRKLRDSPYHRELNLAMAVVLLRLFENEPRGWEAVRSLNAVPLTKATDFPIYLQNWYRATPRRHQPFVRSVASEFGIVVR